MTDSINSYCVGLDVDKKTFKACLLARLFSGEIIAKAKKTFSNSKSGFEQLLDWKENHCKETEKSCSFIMEATGVYHEHLACFLYENELSVHVVVATKAKKYLQSLGVRSKNDQIDAKGLATMGLQQNLQKWQPLSMDLYTLRSLTRQIEALQKSKTVLANQLHAASHSPFTDAYVIKSLKSVIEKLDKEISACQKKVERYVLRNKELTSKYKLYAHLKGFGIITFAVLVAETGGFELFRNQTQLISYSGYDVVENTSGNRVGKTKISKKGNSHVRRILHMASLNMVKYNIKIFKDLHERVFERTKVKMKGYVAIQRKLLCLVYCLWKKNEPFVLDYQK